MIQKPSLSDFVFIALFFSVLASGTQMLSIDSDLGRHLTLGNYILDHGVIPTRDIFSHTLANEARPPYEWLSQVIFALANRLLGLDGVILLTAIIINTAILITSESANRRSKSPLLAFLITALAGAATSIHWLPRPHIVTFLFLAIWVDQLEQLRKGRRFRFYIFPVIMLFWANMHGGFIFGILTWIAYFAGWVWEKWRGTSGIVPGRYWLITGTSSLVATIITPDLWHNWEAVLNNRSAYILSRTVETMRPNFSDPSVIPFILLVGLVVVAFLTSRQTLSASHVFLLTGLGILSIVMQRNIPLFAIASAPILADSFSRKLDQTSLWSGIENRFSLPAHQVRGFFFPLVIVSLVAGFLALNQTDKKPTFAFNPNVFPVQAVDWIESNPIEGNMFNEFNWGGYLLYRLWPGHLVFVDSQSDFYGEPLMREYEAMMIAQDNWRELFQKYEISWVIIPTQAPLAKPLSIETDWKTVYQDTVAVIFVRR